MVRPACIWQRHGLTRQHTVESGGNDAEEMDALRTRYFAENPQVRQVSGSEA